MLPLTSIDWHCRASGTETGNSVGYATTSEKLRQALIEEGVADCNGAPVAVHYCFPAEYAPVPGAKNFLFTMFEAYEESLIMAYFSRAFAHCDGIVVPSRFCADLFRKYTDRPIAVCPLGVDGDLFPFRERSWSPTSGVPFEFLYVGAPNRRKWTVTDKIYEQIIAPMGGRLRLRIKTTGATEDEAWQAWLKAGFAPDVEADADGFIYHAGDVTVDCRRLPYERLHEVYDGAHAMLFLTSGEGWGQTGIEAMASGLPLIVSDATGVREYANARNAFLVRTDVTDLTLDDQAGAHYLCDWPDANHALDRIAEVIGNYDEARRRARRAAREVRRLTWRRSARRLLAILQQWV